MGVKSKSFLFGTAVILCGSELLINILLHNVRHETWICFLIASLVAIPVFLFCTTRRSVCDDSKIISFIYAVYFLMSASYNINILASFVGGYVLEETPRAVFIFLFTLLCGYGAVKGYENLMRLAVIFFTIGFISGVFDILLLWNKIEIKNFQPVFSLPATEYVKGTVLSSLLLIGDLSVLMCFVNEKVKRKDLALGAIAGCAFILITIIRSIGSLGNITGIYTWPTHEALRIINSGNTLTRIETSSVFIMIIMIFFKVSLFISGATEEIKKVFKSDKGFVWVLICSGIVFILSNNMFSFGAEAMDIWEKYSVYLTVPIVVAIPLFGSIKRNLKKMKKSVDKRGKVW